MEKKEFLPIGTVAIMKGGAKRKVMVITRALATKLTGELTYFDYGGCFYPEGLMGEQILYFNEEDIEEVVHKGHVDEMEVQQQEAIQKWLEEHKMKKGNVDDAIAARTKAIEEEKKRKLQEARAKRK